ncbi:MAG: sigma-70 family RNA polymerase sigma factor [Polyangiales bacterium]
MSARTEDEARETRARAVTPVYLALRDALRRFVARRVRPEHVDDLVQDILMRMHGRAGELRDEVRLAGWAFRIAQSVVADHPRARARERAHVGAEDSEDREDDVEEGNVNEIVAGWLRPMLALLPDEYEQAVELVDVQGMSQREYAEHAGLSVSGAKSRVQRGRRMLEELVRACCDLELDARGNVIGFERRSCRP